MAAGTRVAPRTAPPSRPARPARARPPAHRLVALLAAMILGFGAIVARLVVLQVRDAPTYQEMARDQRVREIDLPATRGAIYDRNRQPLALSLPAKAVYANPALVEDPTAAARALSKVLDRSEEDIRAALTSPARFVYLARGLELGRARKVQKLEIPGIGFLDESRRRYPARNLAPQVLGFVGIDGTGLAGLEHRYEEVLAGKAGHERIEADPGGTLIPQAAAVDVPPVPGRDLVLTIDADIQFRAQELLAEAVRGNKAKGGTVIVLDPRSGEILAMATYPWFDPNRFSSADPQHLRNRAVTDVYEPGSVNKVITAAAAIEEGILSPEDRIEVPDRLWLYSKRFGDVHRHPPQPMTLGDIIAKSSNVGAIKVAQMLGESRLYSYLRLFGLGSKTRLGFPGESAGILPTPDRWSGVSIGTIPIGQGVAVTPLQMALVYAAIANGGVSVEPRLVRGFVESGGGFRAAPRPASRRVVSESTARALSRMLAHAVNSGTGSRAQIPGFWVAGKTGTARKPLPDRLGYSDQYVASFMGFVPAAEPALVVTAMLDEPVTEYGSIAAAPLFQQISRYALARLRAPLAPRLPLPPHALPTD